MKEIKLKFVGFYKEFEPKDSILWKTLEKYYDVKIDDNPDYIICGCFDSEMNFTNYPQVRIFISGENFTPDFNLVDYAISPYPISFADRSLYMPQFTEGLETRLDYFENPRHYDTDFLKTKTRFANFIASHESEYGIRGDFMKKLSEYKRVDSVGSYLNNTEDGKTVDFKNSSKIDFQKSCKFSLCFESTSNLGFCTEKLTDAFYAETIPVYYGDPDVGKIFNSKAFINCHDYKNFDEVIEKIKELDSDDAAYLSMMNEPILNDPHFVRKKFEEYDNFVRHIFDQPLDKAFRRSRVYAPRRYENFLRRSNKYSKQTKKLARRDERRNIIYEAIYGLYRKIFKRSNK